MMMWVERFVYSAPYCNTPTSFMPWSNIYSMIIVNMQMDHPRICVNHTIISIKIRNTALIFDHFPLDPKHPQTALLHRLRKEQLNETPKKRHTRKW